MPASLEFDAERPGEIAASGLGCHESTENLQQNLRITQVLLGVLVQRTQRINDDTLAG